MLDGARSGRTRPPFDLDTDFGRELARVDWAATDVGPWEHWPASLANTVRLVTGSRFAMWMAWGPSLTFFCNDAYRRDTLGAKYPWALGRPAKEVWAEIWTDIGGLIDTVVTEGTSTWDERMLLFLERSGYPEETYHTFSYSPIHGDDGTIAGMLCVVSEDTARVISERRMALLRDLSSGLAAASTVDDVCVAARRELVTDASDLPFVLGYLFDEHGHAQLHWSSGVRAAEPWAPTVLHPADSSELWHRAVFAPDDVPIEIDLTAVPGLPRGPWQAPPVEALAVPLQVGGKVHGRLIAGLNPFRALDEDYRDFVDLVAAQLSSALSRAEAFEQERERVEQLAALDHAKTTFFTNVSHELRTPLTLLLGPVEDALADTTNALLPQHRDRLEVVQRNAERLLKLVNTLLDFSRLESGRVEQVYEPLDLARYTGELASMFESAYERTGLELTVDCAPLPALPYVDREMWAKIVLNLLSNALKATFTGGVQVRLRDGDGAAVLEVVDTGVGIPDHELSRLFERFHRVSGAQLRTHEGSGIGLALVAELARLHGGEIAVESRAGVGSTFRVTIPYGRDHLDPDRVRDRASDEVPDAARLGAGYLAEAWRWLGTDHPGSDRRATPATDDHRPSVLVVDDNADMLDYVHGLLAEEFAVLTAGNGQQALAVLQEHTPDLVLTDVMMPVLDGFGLLTAIRQSAELSHIPVVMLSARSGEDATIEGLDAGADDYLVKPFSSRELLARVRANLELDRVRALVSELERSREVLGHAEALAHLGSWEVDLRTDTVSASPELRRMTGLPAVGSVDFDTAFASVVDEDRHRLALSIRAARARSAPFDLEIRATRPDGGTYLARVRGSSITDETGEVTLVRGSTQDITEQRAVEQAMARAEADREAAAREHAIASELQQSLLPPSSFEADGLEIATFYRPGAAGVQVGGDWHDVIDLGDGRVALVIGDVMGRGVRAAAVMGQLRAATRAYARLNLTPDRLIRLLDDTVREVGEAMIVTCVYAVYDARDGLLTYANAGHLPPLVVDAEGTTRRLSAGAPPLGAGEHGNVGETVQLLPGALLVLYTDGLVERRGSDLDAGIDHLASALLGASVGLPELPNHLVHELMPDGPDDDVAILLCRVEEESGTTSRHAVTEAPGALGQAREFATRTLRAWGVDPDTEFEVLLTVSELATNALRYGAPPMQLSLRRDAEGLVVEMSDCGGGVPVARLADPREGTGRGLHIVSELAAAWGVRPEVQGKTVWASFRLPGESTSG